MSPIPPAISSVLDSILGEASMAVRQRGYDYFKQGRIKHWEEVEGIVLASVRGADVYEVQIDLEASDASCSCPAGTTCKHIVALLHAYGNLPPANQSATVAHDALPEIENDRLVIRFLRYGKYFECLRLPVRGNSLSIIDSHTDRRRLSEREQRMLQWAVSGYRPGFAPVEPGLRRILENTPARDLPLFVLSNGKHARFGGTLPIEIAMTWETEVGDLDGDLEEDQTEQAQCYLLPRFRVPGEEQDRVSTETGIFSPDQEEEDFVASGVSEEEEYAYSLFRDEEIDAPVPAGPVREEPSAVVYLLNTPNLPAAVRRNVGVPLDMSELIPLRAELMRLGVSGASDIPRPFTAGPGLCVSLFPDQDMEEDDGKLKIQGRVEIAYAEKEKDLRLKSHEFSLEDHVDVAVDSTLPGPELCCFPPAPVPVHVRGRARTLFARDAYMRVAKRSMLKERKLLQQSLPIKYKQRSGEFSLGPRKIREFLETTWPELIKQEIPVRIHPALMHVFNPDPRSVFVVEKSSGTEWFTGRLEIRGLNAEDRALVLRAARERKQFIQLKNGAWIRLESLGLDKILTNLENLGLAPRKDGTVQRMRRGEAMAMAGEFEGALDVRGDAHMSAFMESLKQSGNGSAPASGDLEEFSPELGANFQGRLRDYQVRGVHFLARLFELGTGGILADDMGLGKTVQSLAFLEHLRNTRRNKQPSLLVAPVAALGVWQKEAQRFFPSMPVLVWHGGTRKTAKMPADGIVLTSFGVLIRDAELLNKTNFRVVLVDEAQFAKNHLSQAYKALLDLSTEAYFCLTGTPLENHIMEFWTLMDLCFPGLLGKRSAFRRTFGNKNGQDPESLRRRIAPFMLRRTKDMVLRELPKKTETSLGIPMTDAQQAIYEQARREAVRELENAGRDYLIKMLPHLMRLRRIACHPRLEKSKDPTASGKFMHLAELLPDLMASSSGILLFSQFTDVLTVTENLLEKQGIAYHRLDGSTPLKQRERMVSEFQGGERHCFLISLKAGGTALTLHRADTVVHLDPWWNPAAERQASDRVHRIGQKRPVFVYRLYAMGTVEEKVLALQNEKRRLFEKLMGENSDGGLSIGREQLLELLEN